ncbi:XdhC family protein [Yunchengibacter salinarum]|uniref:XdhC family protein n=1 Tax=Yunchengibacter salinarum TaxID=3133399 RepID=UPI0035B6685E
MHQELAALHDWLVAGDSAVLGVVVATWGSAPRQPGSLMALHGDGRVVGSLSGGCVEGSVMAEAARLTPGDRALLLDFSVSDTDAFAVGLACGGQLQVALICLGPENAGAVQAALTALTERQGATLHLNLNDGSARLESGCHSHTPVLWKDSARAAPTSLALPIRPSPHLVIVGAVHIARHLAPMAARCDWRTTVLDPRGAFVDSGPIPEATLVEDWPDDWLAAHPLDRHSALVALTHEPRIDDAALWCALGGPAFYIGALGGRKSHARRLERLAGAGFDQDELDRIHGPVGLDIQAATPAEIAVSIQADMIRAYRTRIVPRRPDRATENPAGETAEKTPGETS